MGKRKYVYDDNFGCRKYRCCCGCFHVQTVTKFLCIIFLINFSIQAYKYVQMEEEDLWEFAKILYGFISAISLWIGMDIQNTSYFYPLFVYPVYRMYNYCTLLWTLYDSSEDTDFLRGVNKLLQKYDPETREMLEDLLEVFPLFSILTFLIGCLILIELWSDYIIYKCYKYISVISSQNEFKQKKSDVKRNGSNVRTTTASNNTQKQHVKSNVKKHIKNVPVVSPAIPKNVEKAAPSVSSEINEPVNAKPNVKVVEPEVVPKLKSKQPVPDKPIQQPTVAATSESTKPSKPVERNLNIHQKNVIVQSEAASCTIKLKSTESVQKVIMVPKVEQQISPNSIKSESCFDHQSNISTSKKSKNVELSPFNEYLSNLTESESYSQHQASPNSKPENLSRKVSLNQLAYDDFDTYPISPKLLTPSSSSEEKDYGNSDQKSNITSSGFESISSDAEFSPYQTFSPTSEPAFPVTFWFKDDETYGIEILQNERKQKIKNSFDNEWTPLYFSMAQQSFEVGEKAQIHCHQFPAHVVYDIFKVIGKPTNEIKINPEWRFKVVINNGMKCFQIKTQKGLRLFPESSVVAAFLKSMKIQTETYLNTEISDINLSCNFELTDSQKTVFKDAASKVHLNLHF